MSIIPLTPETAAGLNDRQPVSSKSTANVSTRFREAFQTYPNPNWLQSIASGDIVRVDGNAIGASYLVISLDPLTANTVTRVETDLTVSMPFEVAFGAHLSQRTLGQEFAIEAVSTEEPAQAPPPLAISAISQATTTLTITTTTPHNLRPGMRIGVADCVDSRLNYPSLVVASTPSPLQLTATAGPGGNIPSLNAGPFASGEVYTRSALGLSPNGTSLIFENPTATNASLYAKSEGGDTMPVTGTLIGNHSATIATSASVQAINAALTYAFRPTSEYRLALMADRLQWSDAPIDALTAATSRASISQVIPSPRQPYRLRIRATCNRSLSRPVAQIVSAIKTGTTTATITTDVPHGLTTSDQVVIYGIRDQAAASFPNLVTATAVASVPSATTFTIVIGTASTVTSYGGYVARINGGNLMSALGAVAQVVQSAALSTDAAATRVLTLVGSAAWAGLLIGDYVNLVGCRDNVSGASMGLDGAYRVRNLATTTLELEPIGGQTLPADAAAVNCGGAVIKRTDLRLSYVRIFDFERLRIEALPRPTGDQAGALPVNVQNTVATSFTQPALVAGAALIGDVALQYRATASGLSATHIVAAGSTNATNVKNAAGKVLGWSLANTTASWRYVKLHNLATAPTAGAAVARTIAIPPNGLAQWFSEGGITFATGIGYTIVTGAADTDATAVTANDVVGELFWA